MSTPQKVLVTGAVPAASLAAFFTKVAALHAKHSFSLVLALDLFSGVPDDSLDLANLLAGQIPVPVQVYAAIGRGPVPQKVLDKAASGEELCPNLTLLGKSAVLTLASGLKIATFGGAYTASTFSSSDDADSSYITPASVAAFLTLLAPPPSHSSLPAPPLPPPDILLTHALPLSLPIKSAKPFPFPTSEDPKEGAEPLDQIARSARAKYHFVSGPGVFWEREPFTWAREEGGGVCRAISLGTMGNATKDRWFYAFSITPNAPAAPAPANATASPFSASGPSRGIKRPAGSMEDNGVNEYGVPNYIFSQGGGQTRDRKKGAHGPPPDHYTCNICDQKGHWIQDCPEKTQRDASRGAGKQGARPIQPDECWFCLSNPKVTKHLIAAIGSETYLTLPKGQLLPTTKGTTSDVAPVPGGGHVLIMPIAHYPTLASVPADQAVPIISEMEKYKSALRKCYAKFGASMVSFEVGRLSGKGGHAHVQVVPIPNALADAAEAVFKSEGEKHGVAFSDEGLDALKAPGVDNYFRVDLPDGKTLVHVIRPGVPFGLQFGRATMATLLGIPERTDWKACVKSDAEEKADCVRFKAAFKAFDPSD